MQKMHDENIKEENLVDNYLQQHYGELTQIKFPFLNPVSEQFHKSSTLKQYHTNL